MLNLMTSLIIPLLPSFATLQSASSMDSTQQRASEVAGPAPNAPAIIGQDLVNSFSVLFSFATS